jgi:hypothetical protein
MSLGMFTNIITTPHNYLLHFFTCICDLWTGFGLVNRFIGYSQVVSTSNDNTLKITVTIRRLLTLVVAR